MNSYEKARQFVADSFIKADVKPEVNMRHLDRTVYWLLQLAPDADEAAQIAAVSHDIERAYRKPEDKINQLKWASPEYYREHQGKGANIIADFLRQQGAEPQVVEKVHRMISNHEFGGDEASDLLKDADTLSFMENNIDFFITEQVAKYGKAEVKEKFDQMFYRLTSEKAKQIAKPWYEQAIKKLE